MKQLDEFKKSSLRLMEERDDLIKEVLNVLNANILMISDILAILKKRTISVFVSDDLYIVIRDSKGKVKATFAEDDTEGTYHEKLEELNLTPDQLILFKQHLEYCIPNLIDKELSLNSQLKAVAYSKK